MKTNSNKVALGLSGGVDSSVAAFLLKKQGYEVTGVYMQCWDEKADGCSAAEDRSYAVATAANLGIKFTHLDLRDSYKSEVVDYFYKDYESGRTPNPDVLCNKEIKFGLFYEWAFSNGFNYVATGHYARIRNDGGMYRLLKGTDETKDQSYFLYTLDTSHLKNIIFPIGDLRKKEIRKIAQKEKLPTMARPESMGICFIGEVDIKEFLKKRVKEKLGKVYYVDGSEIGEHDGVWFYTIGQRHGFKIQKYFGKPLYVVSKNVKDNSLVVGKYEDAFSQEFLLDNIHWITNDPFEGQDIVGCDVRIRHLGKLHSCKVRKLSNKYFVRLDEPVFAVASGQSAVFYLNEVVLGGGIIE